MVFAASPGAMAVLWMINGIAQSAVWSPLLRLTVEHLPGVAAMRAGIRYSTTVPIGTLAAYGLAALCTALSGWRTVFTSAGLLFDLCAALILAVNTMLVTVLPIRMQNTGRVGALSGILHSATYIGSALSGWGVVLLAEAFGWTVTLWFWYLSAFAGAALCFFALRLRTRLHL